MKHIKVESLTPKNTLETALYHKGGIPLLERGEALLREDISAMKQLKIEEVIELSPEDDREDFILEAKYKLIDVNLLPEGKKLNKPLTDVNGKVMLAANSLVTPQIKAELRKKGILTVFVKKSSWERDVTLARQFVAIHSKIAEANIIHQINTEVSKLQIDPASIITNPKKEITVRGIDNFILKGNVDKKPKGEPLASKLIKRPPSFQRTESLKKSFVDDHFAVIKETYTLFGHLKQFKDTIDGAYVGEMSRKIIAALIRDKDLFLNLLNAKPNGEYLPWHSFAAAVVAVNIATAMKYSPEQVLEVAYAALLHDVGMYKVPQSIVTKPSTLTTSEFLEVQKHPSYNLDYLQQVSNLPDTTPIIAYQIHERLNRSGYPKQRPTHLIHSYSKIVAVADIYSALTLDRPFRRALSPFRASRTIVELGSSGALDTAVIRNFLQFMCLFPVGSWVRLNNGHIGKIISANSDDYTRPVVHVFFDAEMNPINKYTIDLHEDSKLGIVDGLSFDQFPENKLMDGF